MPFGIKDIKDLLNNLAMLATVLGFGVLGILLTVKAIGLFLLRVLYRLKERKELQPDYDFLRGLAIREGLFNPSKSIRLIAILRRQTKETRSALSAGLRERLGAKLSRLASGSTQLSNLDILTGAGLLLPIGFEDQNGGARFHLPGLIKLIHCQTTQAGSGRSRRTLLIGSAGCGKSLSCLAIEHHFANAGLAGEPRWIFLLTAQEFWDAEAILRMGGNAGLGSEAWCVQFLVASLGWINVTELQRRDLHREVADHAVFVIDGIDEIAGRLGKDQTEVLLTSWLFQRALLVTTRASFYNASLQGNPSVKHHAKIAITPPTKASRLAFVKEICRRVHGAHAQARLIAIEKVLQEYPSIDMLVSTPLLLMMLAEIGGIDTWSQARADSVGLYENFARQIVDRDAPRLQGFCSTEEVQRVYQELAWALFKKASRADVPVSGIDLSELQEIVASIGLSDSQRETNVLRDAIVASPLIAVSGGLLFRGQWLKIGFSHESFMEFHVARRAFSWLTGSTQQGSEFLAFIETPGVSAFLKEYLARIVRDATMAAEVTTRLKRNLDSLLAAREGTTDEFTARNHSFMAGQMAYYLGMVVDDSTYSSLYDIATLETEFWIRRAAAIGLAFGGYPAALNRLIDEMKDAIAGGDFCLARKNIAIELGFYGDQRLDPRDPTLDLGGQSCERLVTRLCSELCSDAEMPNRRMALFDIIYLSQHRSVSEASFESTLLQCKAVLGKALDRMESERNAIDFPEVREVRSILGLRALE